MPAPEIFLKSDAQVGEGPIWSNGSLVWIDIPNGVINTTDISDGKTSIVKLDAIVGAVAPIENSDNYIVAMQEGFALSDGEKLTVIDPVLSNPHLRMNDAKCDALGRLWAGSCEYSFKKGMGALHRLENRGPSSIMSKGFGLPNGLGWTVNNQKMYLVDSTEHQLYVSDFDLSDGMIGDFRSIAEINIGLPDGLAVDVEDCIWLAVWGGSKVLRIFSKGECIAEIKMPVSQPSSCAFGPDGTLYITSARAGLTAEEISNQPLAGSVFAISTNTNGVPVSKFRLNK